MIYEFEYLTQSGEIPNAAITHHERAFHSSSVYQEPPSVALSVRGNFSERKSSQHPFKLAGFLIVSSRLL